MAKPYHRCRVCRRTDGEVGRISRGGYCEECGIKANLDARDQMQAKQGPVYERYLAGVERAQMEQAARYIARLSGQITDSDAHPAG